MNCSSPWNIGWVLTTHHKLATELVQFLSSYNIVGHKLRNKIVLTQHKNHPNPSTKKINK